MAGPRSFNEEWAEIKKSFHEVSDEIEKDRQVNELVELMVNEISAVDRPANRRKFLITKQDSSHAPRVDVQPVAPKEEVHKEMADRRAANEVAWDTICKRAELLRVEDPTLTPEKARVKAAYLPEMTEVLKVYQDPIARRLTMQEYQERQQVLQKRGGRSWEEVIVDLTKSRAAAFKVDFNTALAGVKKDCPELFEAMERERIEKYYGG